MSVEWTDGINKYFSLKNHGYADLKLFIMLNVEWH